MAYDGRTGQLLSSARWTWKFITSNQTGALGIFPRECVNSGLIRVARPGRFNEAGQ